MNWYKKAISHNVKVFEDPDNEKEIDKMLKFIVPFLFVKDKNYDIPLYIMNIYNKAYGGFYIDIFVEITHKNKDINMSYNKDTNILKIYDNYYDENVGGGWINFLRINGYRDYKKAIEILKPSVIHELTHIIDPEYNKNFSGYRKNYNLEYSEFNAICNEISNKIINELKKSEKNGEYFFNMNFMEYYYFIFNSIINIDDIKKLKSVIFNEFMDKIFEWIKEDIKIGKSYYIRKFKQRLFINLNKNFPGKLKEIRDKELEKLKNDKK